MQKLHVICGCHLSARILTSENSSWVLPAIKEAECCPCRQTSPLQATAGSFHLCMALSTKWIFRTTEPFGCAHLTLSEQVNWPLCISHAFWGTSPAGRRTFSRKDRTLFEIRIYSLPARRIMNLPNSNWLRSGAIRRMSQS
jgi:hypothetical protein